MTIKKRATVKNFKKETATTLGASRKGGGFYPPLHSILVLKRKKYFFGGRVFFYWTRNFSLEVGGTAHKIFKNFLGPIRSYTVKENHIGSADQRSVSTHIHRISLELKLLLIKT